MALEPVVKINVLNSVSGIYLFSSLSFSVYYGVFKSRMCNLTFDFILHLYSFFRCFCSFLFPLKVCIADRRGLCLTACARAEEGWDRESGCGIGVMDVTDAKCKRQPKEK